MINKFINYYKCFGFVELLKKINRYIVFSFKSKLAYNGVYQFGKNEEKNIIKKSKKAYIFTYYNYTNLDDKIKIFLKQLSQLGFEIFYILLEKKNKEKLLPLGFYKNFKCLKNRSLSFSFGDLVLIHSYNDEFKNIYDDIKKSESFNFFLADDKDSYNLSLEKFSDLMPTICFDKKLVKEKKDVYWKDSYKKFIKGKCNSKFFNNISIIVLNYNNKNVIGKCIDSLLKYNMRYKYEIIVVDNQSTDGSYELLKKYKDIMLFRNSKNGCSSGRNLGVSKSTKDYIVFLDSDQWALNDYWLDNYIYILNENSIVGAVGWAGGWFNKQGYAYHTFDSFEYRFMPPQGLYRYDIGYLGTGGFMIRKEFFEKIKGFDLKYDPTCYEDTDLSLNIRHHGKEIVYCPYLGIEHKPHQTTKSGSSNHNRLIKEKGDYFVKKWKKINPKLLNYCK